MVAEALSKLHWSELKKMAEDKGLKYDGKEKTIAMLAEETPGDAPVSVDAEVAADTTDVAKKDVKCDIRLDMTKDYGTIHGEIDGAPGACFSQGGKFFTSTGELA